MKDKTRRNYQKKLRHIINIYNKQMEDDELFRGRFVIRQLMSDWQRFADNSGGILVVYLRVFDKKNGDFKDYHIDYAPYIRTLHWNIGMDVLNNFITEVSTFWDETPSNTVSSAVDYRNVEIPYEAFQIRSPLYKYACFDKKGNIKDILGQKN